VGGESKCVLHHLSNYHHFFLEPFNYYLCC
jgi:hypothetical protein